AVAGAELRGYDARWLAVVWPALAARVGLALDRRGTDRLAEFTIHGAAGARIQLSGGFEAILHRGFLHLRRSGRRAADGARRQPEPRAGSPLARDPQPLSDVVVFGEWRFRRLPGETPASEWAAPLPADLPLTVRAWRAGDRMVPHGAAVARRVKGLFRDAGVDAVRRGGWPVVMAGDEIVWIPGVRRSGAAAERSGRPTVTILCERIAERDDH
ncbi:MAG TPA: tRNA lysidine(34) synthetase TilS, partial [Gemmatimonadaceae bacterium]|nr:tRNA lysidine(34) synthetase TilS [Gemmatimonadaceae bacterium]